MKLRPQLSLMTLMLLMTIVALATACWKLHTTLQPLREQVIHLEEENLQVRNQAGLLTIRDKSKLHAIESPRFSPGLPSPRERAWNIWVPEGSLYELHITTGWYDGGVMPDESPKGPIILEPGEHSALATIIKRPQNKGGYLQLEAKGDKLAISAKWIKWENSRRSYRGVNKHTVVSDPDNPLLLWSAMVENSNNQEKDGMIVWLQPVSE